MNKTTESFSAGFSARSLPVPPWAWVPSRSSATPCGYGKLGC